MSPKDAAPPKTTMLPAALAALGIVFGDLGTSPLYTLQTVVADAGGHLTPPDILGLLSLIVWALLATVSIKYCLFVMRADNNGEGGILALMSLVTGGGKSRHSALIAMGLFGAALIYGDGVITPAISVLSAFEGLNLATTAVKPFIVPATVLVLIALFAVQPRGTAKIGRIFGPVMTLWFAAIAALGIAGILTAPGVLLALSPHEALGFLLRHGLRSFFVLGGVFLAITGGEALYADMGHLGRGPIRLAWYSFVLPALLLSYAGQSAYLLHHPTSTGNPFFLMVPAPLLVPLVILAAFATIIASQAIITGAFSLTRQAMQLGWFPGLAITQTSDREYGQIYVPFVNWTMMAGTVALTLAFRSSDRLAGAYGTAVATTMLLTTALLFNAMRDVWRWKLPVALLTAGIFLAIDLVFFGANLLKIVDGGFVPLTLGAGIFVLMRVWREGILAVAKRLAETDALRAPFLADLAAGRILRIPGTGVFLNRDGRAIPQLMLRQATQLKSLHETAISLSVIFEPIPRVPPERRAVVEDLGNGLYHITVTFGFMEIPNIPAALAFARAAGCPVNLADALFFAAHDDVVPSTGERLLPGWMRVLFAFMFRNAVQPVDRYALPASRFISIGRQAPL